MITRIKGELGDVVEVDGNGRIALTRDNVIKLMQKDVDYWWLELSHGAISTDYFFEAIRKVSPFEATTSLPEIIDRKTLKMIFHHGKGEKLEVQFNLPESLSGPETGFDLAEMGAAEIAVG